MKQTIMAIGANSTLAQAVLPLLAKEYKIVTAGRRGCDIYCDVTKEVNIPKDIDIVINFAAAFGGSDDAAINSAVETNVTGVVRVCEAARTAGVSQVVHISSIFALLKPGDPQYSVYALTKRLGDELSAFYCAQRNVPLTILRISRIYGDSQLFAKGQPFLYQLISKAARGEDIEFYGAHDARRNYMHTLDIAEVLLRVLNIRLTGTYPCVNPQDSTYSQIASMAQRLYGKGGKVSWAKDKPDIADDMIIPDQSLYEKINFRPVVSIEAGIRRIKQHAKKGDLK